MNIVTTVIKSRHSVRKFKPDPVDDKVIRDAIECAAHAPTAKNAQPWLFGIIKNKDLLKTIAQTTDNGKFIEDAPLCIAVFGERNEKYYVEDCCAATENLILALQAYGINSCWVAGEKKPYAESIRTLLGVPEKYTLVSLVAAGCPLELTIAPKKEMKQIVFYEEFKLE
jgi:nitroreductase